MMKERRRIWPAALGVALCAAALASGVALQRMGYLTYLNSDMSSELILARRQADTGSLVQMDWLYSTEIHTLHMNLFYALAFLLTPDYALARIAGNVLVTLLAMAACAALLRKSGLTWGASLLWSSLMGMTPSVLIASNVTIGGYYIIHYPLAYALTALWLTCGARRGRVRLAALSALSALLGLLSVRYVLCFVCPMAVTAAMELMLARSTGASLEDRHGRFALATALGLAACAAGYAASLVLVPRLFQSGTGGAGSFAFAALDGQALCAQAFTVLGDALKLIGWRGSVPVFSMAGMGNLCAAGACALGIIVLRRAMKPQGGGRQDLTQRRLIAYALFAALVNLLCFLLIEGAYLSRYLVLPALLLVPAVAVAVHRERSSRLRIAFVLLLCGQLALCGGDMLVQTRAQMPGAQARGEDAMDAAEALMDAGYTHGYGTFWHVRTLQERTGGALTMTALALTQAEDGAVCPFVPTPARWLEPDEYADLDICPGKTFLLLHRDEQAQLADWLAFCGAPVIHENDTFAVYGFDSSQALTSAMLFGGARLENASYEDGAFALGAGGRVRVGTHWREAGSYTLTLSCTGEPGEDARVRVYTGRDFALLAEMPLRAGENTLRYALAHGDKYAMILMTSGEAGECRVSVPRLYKEQ